MNWRLDCRKSVLEITALAFVLAGPWFQHVVAQSICAPQIQWQRSFGGQAYEEPYAIQQTLDGGYIVGGIWVEYQPSPSGNITSTNYGYGDFWMVRLDATGEKLWDRAFGGPSSDSLYAIQQTSDGGFILGGESWSGVGGNKTSPAYGATDFWVVRTDASGGKLWDQSFGGSGFDTLRSLLQTADGGFVLGGNSSSPPDGNKTSSNFGNDDFWVIRLDRDGNKLWERTYGGSLTDVLIDLKQTSDGGFILAGASFSAQDGTKTSPNRGYSAFTDYWLVRLDANGNQLWDRSYGGEYTDWASAVLQTADGGFLVGGYSISPSGPTKTSPEYGGLDFWLVRVDSTGEILWDRSFGGQEGEELNSLAAISDGGWLLTGLSSSPTSGTKQSRLRGGVDAWVVRVDQNGNQLWEQSFGGRSYDVGRSALGTQDGGFILAVGSQSQDGNRTSPGFGDLDFWIVKLTPETLGDCDNDGVPDELDVCPETPFGEVVNSAGCALDQLCPCKNLDAHNQYVACVRRAAADFERAGLISREQRQQIISQAIVANCPPVFLGVPDIAFGLPHVPIEGGVLSVGSSEYPYVNVVPPEPDTTDPYGVSVLLGEADSGVFFDVGAPVYGVSDPAWYLDVKAYGTFQRDRDELIATARGTKPAEYYYPVEVDLSPLNPTSVTVQYLCNGAVLSEDTISGAFGSFVVDSYTYLAPRFNPFWRMADGSVGALLELSQDGSCDVGYPYDQIFVRADHPGRQVDFVSRVDAVGGGGLPAFSFSDERLGMFNRKHKALGPVLFDAASGQLTVTSLGQFDDQEFTGVLIEAPKAEHLEMDFTPIELDPENSVLQILAVGRLLEEAAFASTTFQSRSGALEVLVDFKSLFPLDPDNSVDYRIHVTAFKNGVPTGHLIISNAVPGTLSAKHNKAFAIVSCVVGARPDVSLGFGLDHIATFTSSDGAELTGDHFRFAPVAPFYEANWLSEILVTTHDLASFTITGERSRPAMPHLNISSDSRQVVLSWTDNTRLFAVESAISLSAGFTTVTNDVDFLDHQSVLAVPVEDTGPRFFRLRR